MTHRYFSYVNWHEFLFALWGGWRPPMWPLVHDPRLDEYGCTMQLDAVLEWEYLRDMAFKRIDDEFHSPRRRRKEKLKWYMAHPSPRSSQEKLRNLKMAFWN